MLWKNLINAVVQYAAAHPQEEGVQRLLATAQVEKMTVREFLEAGFDIRNVGNLRRLVPMAFPRPLRRGELIIDENHHNHWRVTTKKSS